ncbi:MAG: tetratricopeptide repeat protein [Methyloprofundus sp.]|uniref:tetratricopeptide repeat protein n=1 Tax=Methyloprofundus sp. TaxID=2020875 RepID=UPI001A17DED2|nr:tetratricopeptide repeat protein [Methyloprofundus sp.]HIL77695.1 tetratricopeptide repeat protein [Methylococcales bacterium]
MIKTYCKLFLPLSILILSACAGNIETRSAIILNAGNYTSDGVQAFAATDWQRAQFSFTKALRIYQGIDNQQGVISSHINLAEVALAIDDYPTVKAHLLAASDRTNKALQVDNLNRIALLYAQNAIKQNQTALANQHLQSLLPEFDNETPVGNLSQIELIAIADRTKLAFIENNDASLWTRQYANALTQSNSKDSDLKAHLLRYQAALLRQQGDVEAAAIKLQQALIQYKKNLSRPGIALTLSELGELTIAQGRWQEAKKYVDRSLAVYQYLDDVQQIYRLNKILVEIESHIVNLHSGQ